MRLGIIANEFFEQRLGRMGGFGWVARGVADACRAVPDLRIEPVFLTEERQAQAAASIGGVPLVAPGYGKRAYVRRLYRQHVDVLLTIDYRPSYDRIIRALPRTPLILWAHDPRTPYDDERLATLRVPGDEGVRAQGVDPIDSRAFKRLLREATLLRRPVRYAAHARYLREKFEGTYGITPGSVTYLPDPVHLPREAVRKGGRPNVLFLARLDPYKRPWLVVDLARRLPDADFVMLGQNHFSGPGSWQPRDLPPNVSLEGHVEGENKLRALREAWLLLNTSIHEALPISFLEALSFEAPIVAGQDPDEVTSRFGIYVPRTNGTGEAALPHFERAIRRLLADHDLRRELGRQGRAWVETTHNQQTFLTALQEILASLGIRPGEAPAAV
jgi:glycosyltransferase involved in cell wall biosynthesis